MPGPFVGGGPIAAEGRGVRMHEMADLRRACSNSRSRF